MVTRSGVRRGTNFNQLHEFEMGIKPGNLLFFEFEMNKLHSKGKRGRRGSKAILEQQTVKDAS